MLDLSPVVCIDQFAGGIITMPTAMVNAYVPYAQHLNLEEAARVAAIRDTDEATNFLLSVQDCAVLSMPVSEAMDEVSVEFETSAVRSS